MDSYCKKIQDLLAEADVEINGERDWDIQVNDERFYKRVIAEGSLGLGESYMEQWWDVKKLDQFFCQILHANLDDKINPYNMVWLILRSKLFNLQSIRRAFSVAKKHYDVGNDLFSLMLDKRKTYTCGYWKNAKDLDQAQEDKLDLVCRKIGLKKNQLILDIGCGWGSFIKYAAEKYSARCVGVTVSKEQAEFAKKDCAHLPIEVRLQDYRMLDEKFDHIVSLGMFEHVGHKNYKKYMQVASKCLKENGVFLLHTIGANRTRYTPDPWIHKYIFPNGVLPSMSDISKAIEGYFVLEDFHSFGTDYDKTLMAWFHNFDTHWYQLCEMYGDQFYRMWKYYLLGCAGAFRGRNIQLWQLVLTKNGMPNGYIPIT
ncbi:MAG: cyclopropane fatty acyl phospholipid synthase [Gammaproteobacteria bacterium]